MRMTYLKRIAAIALLSAPIAACGGGGDGPNSEEGEDGSTGGAEAGDGDVGGGCSNCTNGCCDGDTCIPFGIQSTWECGSEGNSCIACGTGMLCVEGSCEIDFSVCSSHWCDGCCDLSGTCVAAGDMSSEACGYVGLSCNACANYGVVCDGSTGSCSEDIDPEASFRLRFLEIEVGSTLPGGDDWDPFEGLPDLYIGLSLSGATEEEVTGCPDDSLTCDLSEVTNTVVTGQDLSSGAITVTVYDSDLDAPEVGGTTAIEVAEWASVYELGPFGSVTKLTFSLEAP